MKEFKCSRGYWVGLRPVLLLIGALFLFPRYPGYSVMLTGLAAHSYYSFPTPIIIDKDAITVKKNIFSVTVKMPEIKSMSRSGFGEYAFSRTPGYYKLASQYHNFVLIRASRGRNMFITPDDRDGFLEAVREMHPPLVSE